MPVNDLVALKIPELKTDFLFRRRPVAIPGDLRPSWRISLLVLLLKNCCRGGRTSHKRLHILNWAVSTATNRQELQDVIAGNLSPDSVIIRFDPFLIRALDFAIGEGLVVRFGGDKVQLTEAGKALAEEIERSETTLYTEKTFINAIRHGVTETLVNQIFGSASS